MLANLSAEFINLAGRSKEIMQKSEFIQNLINKNLGFGWYNGEFITNPNIDIDEKTGRISKEHSDNCSGCALCEL